MGGGEYAGLNQFQARRRLGVAFQPVDECEGADLPWIRSHAIAEWGVNGVIQKSSRQPESEGPFHVTSGS